jgi:hypothetical protein
MVDEPISPEQTARVFDLLGEAKALAREYYELTGRPLGITSEIAEYEASRLLNLTLAPVRQAGYDAVRVAADGQEEKLQIKGRSLPPGAKPSQRIGRIRLDHEWDVVLLVLLDEHFQATAIYEAGRDAIIQALTAPGSKARNERGQLSVPKFRSIGTPIWTRSATTAGRSS